MPRDARAVTGELPVAVTSFVGWSYQLCTRQERRLWARLSVFAGGFGLDAATEVCADPGTIRQRSSS